MMMSSVGPSAAAMDHLPPTATEVELSDAEATVVLLPGVGVWFGELPASEVEPYRMVTYRDVSGALLRTDQLRIPPRIPEELQARRRKGALEWMARNVAAQRAPGRPSGWMAYRRQNP